jgi:hypothetical protein
MKVLRKIGLDDATSADLAQLPQRYIYEPLDGKVRKELRGQRCGATRGQSWSI